MTGVLCRMRGHRERVVMLPEDLFGLYVYSRIECSRCGVTLETGMTPAAQIEHLVTLLDECRDVAPSREPSL